MEQAGAPVRVFVADDHPLVREGIVEAVGSRAGLEVAGSAADGRTALEEIRRLLPEVAVLDIRMPGLSGTQVAGALTRDGIATRVLLLSAYVDSAVAYEALAQGAAGFLSKHADRQAICDAILAASRGETVLSADVQGDLAQEIRQRAAAGRPSLTPREREILALIAEGCSAPQIAGRLYLSPATVKGHLQNIYEKLGVSDRAAAVAEGMRRGLLE